MGSGRWGEGRKGVYVREWEVVVLDIILEYEGRLGLRFFFIES